MKKITSKTLTKVMLFGTFDGIHKGHLHLLNQAKKLGNHLVVLIARDATVVDLKKKKTQYNEHERAKAIATLPFVREVILGEHDHKHMAILEVKPDLICLGYDQVAFTENLTTFLEEHNVHCKIMRLKPFFPEKYKTSLLCKQKSTQ